MLDIKNAEAASWLYCFAVVAIPKGADEKASGTIVLNKKWSS